MSEFNAESLSALMDSETEELEVRRLLAQLETDSEIRARWCRYHTARSALQKEQLDYAHIDISTRVREQIDNEAPHALVTPVSENVKPDRAAFSFKPLAGLAVAASVTAMVFFGVQSLDDAGSSAQGPVVASGQPVVNPDNRAVPVRQSNMQAGAGSATSADQQAAERWRKQRMQTYMQLHAQQASVNIGQGVLPLARVASHDVE